MSERHRLIREAAAHQEAGRWAEAGAIYTRLALDPAAPVGVLVNLGRIKAALGDAAGAAAALQRAIERDPNSVGAYNNLGVLLQASGETAGARAAFDAALAIDPFDRETLVNLGSLAQQAGDASAAAGYFERALPGHGDWFPLRFNYGLALAGLGRHDDARGHLEAACRLRPDHAEAEIALADTLGHLGRVDTAAARLAALLAAKPDDPSAQFRAGIALHTLGRREDAATAYARATLLAPEVAEPFNNLGQALTELGRHDEALRAVERALALQPDFAEAWNTRGNVLVNLGRIEEATEAYRRVLALKPDFPVALVNLAQQLADRGELDEARRLLERALALEPRSDAAWNGLGLVALNAKDFETAIRHFRRALEMRPAQVNAANNLAAALQEMGRMDEALETYLRLIATGPTVADPYFNVANLLQGANRHAEAAAMLRRAIQLKPDHAAAYNLLVHSMLHDCVWDNIDATMTQMLALAEAAVGDPRSAEIAPFGLLNTPASPALLLKASRFAARRIEQKLVGLRPKAPFVHRKSEGKLRIGYISPDFRIHSVAYAFAGLLESHDRRDFAWYGYSTTPRPEDDMTARLRHGFDGYAEIARMNALEAAALVNGHGVDLLVDLAGHTRNTGLGVLSFRPAAVQAHYLGYGATIGAPWVDYLITDDWYGAPDLAPHFDEALVHLPGTMMATAEAQPDQGATTRRAHGLPEDGVVFANFNAHHKFDPALWDIWMRLLRRHPGSVLWMVEGTAESRANLAREATARGVDASRLVFALAIPHGRHLARHALADLALDTHHHSGGVTTVDAMRVAVPVVTSPGSKPNGRTSASILAAMGARDLIAADLDGYERLASALAADPEKRAAIKTRLASVRRTAPLFDRKALARRLESAYRRMIERRAAGLAPAPFRVAD